MPIRWRRSQVVAGGLPGRLWRTTGRRDGETLVPPVQFLSIFCCSRLACTHSATDCCLAQVVPKAHTHTLASLHAVNSIAEAFGLHSSRMEKRARSMLLVAASLSAVRTLEVDFISTSAPFLTVCGNFRCVVQHFSGSSMMISSSSRAHANQTVMLCRHWDRIS